MTQIRGTEYLAATTNDISNNIYVFNYQACTTCELFPCKNCHYSCKTCDGVAETGCLTCQSADHRTFYSIKKKCPCDVSYFDDGYSLCQPCNYQCYECSGSAINCISCNDQNTNRAYSLNSCPCNNGYFDNGSKVCQSCDYSCYKCSGSAANCISCNDQNTNRLLSINSCPCKNGYFDNGSKICKKCNYFCYECIQNENNCISCNDAITFRYLFENNCLCNSKYFDNQTSNAVCVQKQLDCQVQNDDGTCKQFQKCDIGKYRSLQTYKCIEICQNEKINTYGNQVTKECTLCSNNCKFCLNKNPTDCIFLEGTIIHLNQINAINIFSFQFQVKLQNIDKKYQNAIKNALLAFQTNFFQYCEIQCISSKQIYPNYQIKNQQLIVDFQQVLSMEQNAEMNVHLIAQKIESIQQLQDNSYKELILAFAPIIFTYKDLQAQSHQDYLPLILTNQDKIENCQIFIDASLTKTKSSNTLILKFYNIKYAAANNLQYLEKERLNLILILQIDSIASNFTYELEKKTNDGFSQEYYLNLLFQNSFANSPLLILSFQTIIFENYCKLNFMPQQINLILDNYYKTSDDQNEVLNQVTFVNNSTQSAMEITTGVFSIFPSGVLFATSSYQMNQLIFISLIQTTRPTNMISQKRQTGVAVPQLSWLAIPENPKDSQLRIGEFLLQEYPSYCLNTFSCLIFLKSFPQKLLQNIVWKLTIVLFFLSKVGFSVFTWTNIKYLTFHSVYGCVNWIFAFILKGIQLYFYYFVCKLLYLKYKWPSEKLAIENFTHQKKCYEKCSFQSITYETFEKFHIFYQDYKTNQLQTIIYPLQELLKIELLSISAVFLWRYPMLQTILLIVIISANIINYIYLQQFRLPFKFFLTILNDSFIILQCFLFYYIQLYPNQSQEDIYSIGQIYCFFLIEHKVFCSVFYIFIMNDTLFQNKNLNQQFEVEEINSVFQLLQSMVNKKMKFINKTLEKFESQFNKLSPHKIIQLNGKQHKYIEFQEF